mgnify:CR=1 FL=1
MSPFDGLRIPRDLLCEFFAVFSRFEFTLKEQGFMYVNRNGRAAPDWCGFAASAAASLNVDAGSDLAHAIDYLNNDPPQVQVSAQGWSRLPLRGSTAIERAIDAIQRVRNNLFHGGKHTPHSPEGRDEKLVRLSLLVLNACLMQDENLRTTYEQTNFK